MPRKTTTPMMEQYYQIKDQYPDAFLFYRVGDFYELYEDDAIKGSQILELTLTHRSNKSENPIPMAGVPHMAVDSYVNTLVEKGYKVAICEQLEDPKKAKGMVKRGIIQLVTPGTKMAQGPDDSQESNYLTSVVEKAGGYGLAYSDLSTGEIFATHVKRYAEVVNELLSLRTREVVFAGNLSASDRDRLQKANITVSEPAELEGEYAEISYVQQKLTDSMEKAAVRQLVVYLLATQKRSLAHLQVAESFEIGQYLQMANTVQRDLELTQSATTGRKQGSLFWVLDKTTTAMGGRLLKQWLSRPLLSLDRIKQRQQMVQALLDDYFTRENIVDSLKGVYDLERLSGRVAFGNVNPRELLQLAKSLEATKPIIQALAESGNPDLEKYGQGIDPQSELAESITNCLVDQPPISAKDGGIIRAGVSEDLDKYREAMNGGKKWLAQMEMEERQRTGIDNLKIGYNRVFGYFIQVSKGNVAKVPQDRYTRKQTLTNAERYITPELKEHENLILEAESRSTDLEYELFSQLREAGKAHIPALQELGRQLAALDVFVAFAQDAEEKNYCRPSFSSKNEIAVKNGRHPVVEAVLPAGSYIPNDLVMDEDTSIYLITGPNMSGKSTYMRQLALIAIMAQIGSFVPADSAKLPVFDQVFTRIGAADDLYSGKSTFMVEMSEANEALQHASSRSLVLFDEIGRGTATYDGMALAGAIIKYLHDKVGAKTLFATHYHELTELEGKLSGVTNYCIAVKEKGDDIVFLRKIVKGGADKSYGIQVAKLAGVPDSVINRAKELVEELSDADITAAVKDLASPKKKPKVEMDMAQMSLFDTVQDNDIIEELKGIDIGNLTPMEALNTLYNLQNKIKNRW